MGKMIVKAVDAKGHWAFGRFWPPSAVELDIVDEPEEEKSKLEDSHDDGARKFALRGKRLAGGKATHREVEQIRAYSHLVEVVREECMRCKEFEDEIKKLKAEAKKAAK